MKIFLTALFIFLSSHLFAQWYEVANLDGLCIEGIYMLDENNGFIYGWNVQTPDISSSPKAFLIKTSSGWEDSSSWDTTLLYSRIGCMYFVDSLHGFAGGENYFFKTSDGGCEWEQIQYPVYTLGPFSSIYFRDTLNGFMSGRSLYTNESRLIVTHDGGNTWITEIYPLTNPYIPISRSDISFVDEQHGFCGRDYYTIDGGDTWVQRDTVFCTASNQSVPYFGMAEYYNLKIGFLADGLALDCWHRIYKTMDGGASYTPIETPFIALSSIEIINLHNLFLFGRAVTSTTNQWSMENLSPILKSVDGGESWSFQQVNYLNGNPNYWITIMGMACLDENIAYAAGMIWDFRGGHIFKTTNGGGELFDTELVSVNNHESKTGVSIYPNPVCEATSFINENSFPVSVSIVDIHGTQVNHFKIESKTNFQIDLSSFKSGVYILIINDDIGNSWSEKVVKL